MQKAPYFFLIMLICISSSCLSQKKEYTDYEKNCIRVFKDFRNYVHSSIKDATALTDSSKLYYLLSNYLFTNSKLDTSKQIANNINAVSNGKIDNLKTELNSFYQYVQERENAEIAEHLSMLPLRFCDEKYIYNQLTSFQKENTFVFYNDRAPKRILGYMLFIPPMKDLISSPKIWSWTLEFKFGKFVFKSLTGEEGYEYMF